MALKKAPKNAEEFSKSSKFFWVFKCDKKTCESYTPSSKSSSPRMVGQEDYLKILSGKSLPKRYGNIHPIQQPGKEKD